MNYHVTKTKTLEELFQDVLVTRKEIANTEWQQSYNSFGLITDSDDRHIAHSTIRGANYILAMNNYISKLLSKEETTDEN